MAFEGGHTCNHITPTPKSLRSSRARARSNSSRIATQWAGKGLAIVFETGERHHIDHSNSGSNPPQGQFHRALIRHGKRATAHGVEPVLLEYSNLDQDRFHRSA